MQVTEQSNALARLVSLASRTDEPINWGPSGGSWDLPGPPCLFYIYLPRPAYRRGGSAAPGLGNSIRNGTCPRLHPHPRSPSAGVAFDINNRYSGKGFRCPAELARASQASRAGLHRAGCCQLRKFNWKWLAHHTVPSLPLRSKNRNESAFENITKPCKPRLKPFPILLLAERRRL